MNMVNILFFISGCISTFIFMSMIKNKTKVYRRKGLIEDYPIVTESNDNIKANIEVEEIDSSDTKSKVRVLEIVANKSKYNTSEYKGKIKSLINNTWIDSSSIEWVKSKNAERAEKLDKILN